MVLFLNDRKCKNGIQLTACLRFAAIPAMLKAVALSIAGMVGNLTGTAATIAGNSRKVSSRGGTPCGNGGKCYRKDCKARGSV
jgi:hypothetical protein